MERRKFLKNIMQLAAIPIVSNQLFCKGYRCKYHKSRSTVYDKR